MALSADTNRVFELGVQTTVPVKASAQIYLGSAVGFTSGYARALVAGDDFAGFALENKLGTTDGAVNCAVSPSGQISLAITSLAVTDIGKPVYASDDGTFTLTQGSNSKIGTVARWVSTGVGIIRYAAQGAGADLSGVTVLTDNTGGSANNTLADGFTQGSAFTDNSTGSASTTLAAGVGVQQITFPLNLAAGPMAATSAADLITDFVPGYKFKLLALDFVTSVAGVGSSATQTAHLEIGATPVTDGTCVITEASTSAVGELTAGAAISGANTGTSSDTISVLIAASGTAFTGGSGSLVVTIQNMDTADAVASLAARADEARTDATTQNDNDSDLATKVNEIINAAS